jgi:hypothetical protein
MMLTSARHSTLTHFNALHTLTSYDLISILTLYLHLYPTFSLEFCIKFCEDFWCLPYALRIPPVLFLVYFSHGGETEFNWYCGHCLAYCTRSQMINDVDCAAIRGMRSGRGNRSTRRTPGPVPLCPPQTSYDLTWASSRAPAVGSRRLIAWAMYPTWMFERRRRPILFLFWILIV